MQTHFYCPFGVQTSVVSCCTLAAQLARGASETTHTRAHAAEQSIAASGMPRVPSAVISTLAPAPACPHVLLVGRPSWKDAGLGLGFDPRLGEWQ